MKGQQLLINGDRWTVVDVAPAAELAEMVAVILEEEGFAVYTRGASTFSSDVLSHLGMTTPGATYVLVPEADAERALALIAETVTDYEGEDLEDLGALLEDLALESGSDDDFDDDSDDDDDA